MGFLPKRSVNHASQASEVPQHQTPAGSSGVAAAGQGAAQQAPGKEPDPKELLETSTFIRKLS